MEAAIPDIFRMTPRYGRQTFEVLSSRCKPGYAESGIVNGLLDLIAEIK